MRGRFSSRSAIFERNERLRATSEAYLMSFEFQAKDAMEIENRFVDLALLTTPFPAFIPVFTTILLVCLCAFLSLFSDFTIL